MLLYLSLLEKTVLHKLPGRPDAGEADVTLAPKVGGVLREGYSQMCKEGLKNKPLLLKKNLSFGRPDSVKSRSSRQVAP